ncbi:MAG TPA: DUF72 domain-containing protein, partial [Flavisolibacter sp.]|nr:DUF72 domain-containing protein [Flavisolibacter sp.]
HPAWFTDVAAKETLFTKLRELKIGAVITDTPGRRDVVHMYLTLPKNFVRLVCNSLHPTSFERTNDWIQHIQNWMNLGLEETYIFLHPGDDAAIPDLASYWIEEIKKHCQLNLTNPASIQQTLFH